MIVEDKIINEWKIFNAEDFRKQFKIKKHYTLELRGIGYCDEDYIMEHLIKDKRKFRITFMESIRDNAYEEYWLIQEVA